MTLTCPDDINITTSSSPQLDSAAEGKGSDLISIASKHFKRNNVDNIRKMMKNTDMFIFPELSETEMHIC